MTYLGTCDARHEAHTAIDESESDAIARLRPLLAAAAELDLQNREGWLRLRHAARVTTGVLAAGGALPEHLAVGADDSPALVARTIAAAWRHTTSAPSRQVTNR
jgi:hypothetical protein